MRNPTVRTVEKSIALLLHCVDDERAAVAIGDTNECAARKWTRRRARVPARAAVGHLAAVRRRGVESAFNDRVTTEEIIVPFGSVRSALEPTLKAAAQQDEQRDAQNTKHEIWHAVRCGHAELQQNADDD